MRKIVTLVIVCTLFLNLCACGQNVSGQTNGKMQETWQEQYDLGIRYLEEGNYEEAIIAFTAAIEIDPKRAPAYVGRGDAYVGSVSGVEITAQTLEFTEAEADYLKAIELDALTVEVYGKLADLYLTIGDIDHAIAILEQGVNITNDRNLQIRLDELTEHYQEETQDIITTIGCIVMSNFDESYFMYNEEHDFRVGMRPYGIQFEAPINVQIDSQSITIQEAEASNLDEHFDEESQLFNYITQAVGPMIGQRMILSGYVYQRNPAGELTTIEEGDNADMVDYIYHPYGEYAFHLISYELLD